VTFSGRRSASTRCWDRLVDGDIGLSIEDGKKIMAVLQSANVDHEAETYSLFRRFVRIVTHSDR
jgi:hypothetical protein